jgi:hypothetical protein
MQLDAAMQIAGTLLLTSTSHSSHFSQGYETLGFSRKGNKTIYREWAPGGWE